MVNVIYTQSVIFLLVCFSLLFNVVNAAEVNDVRLWRAPDYTRVVLDLSGPIEHKLITLKNPDRIVIDIAKAKSSATFAGLDFQNSPISNIRTGVKDKVDLRLVLDITGEVNPRSFLLRANEKTGDRLVIDLYDKEPAQKPKIVKHVDHVGKRNIVIAIDAGHGGEDPGASGPNKLREKKVVLAISKELNYLLSQRKGFKPVLIRTGDYYIGLKARRQLARKAQADLLVSIHADAFTDSRAHGTSVYALSRKGASSATARFLAGEANDSDLVGGVSLNDKDDVLASVLTDLSMSASLDMSLQAGAMVVNELGGISRQHSKKVEQANFSVLRSPDIPSLLIETGFISNPGEAKKLNTKAYQRKMARAIFNGITKYYDNNPPPDTYLAWQKRNRDNVENKKPLEYVIARGDTLSGIAKRYRVSVSAILQKNDLASSAIRTGQKILIPAT